MDIRHFDVLKKVDSCKESSVIDRKARVIWQDDVSREFWLFYVEKPHRSPFTRLRSDVEEAIEVGVLEVTTVIAAQTQHKSLEGLTKKEKASMDLHWERLSDLMDEKAMPLLLDQDARSHLLKQIAVKYDVSYQMMLKDLYQYWACGGNPMAFVPRWYNCGAKGQIQKEGQLKRGVRQKQIDASDSSTPNLDLPLTPKVRTKLIAGITKFVVANKPPKTAFEETLADQFSDGYELVDGVAIPILDYAIPKPTIHQFVYLIGLEKKSLILQRQLTPENQWQLLNRPVLHRAALQTFGPCHRFEIDATIVDIYLVCSFNRSWIVGRPILYVVIDVWSRVVVGFHLAFEGPSWYTARFALYSAFTNKQALCARYGRKISAEEWACQHLPMAILGDRGEMISKASDELPRSLKIDAENAPPFRGDWKPFVEREFGLVQAGRIHFSPGCVVKASAVKGMRDPRLNACLTIYELGQIILECLLRRNRAPRDGHELPVEFVQAGHSVGSPMDTWKWGLENMTGAVRRFDEAQVLTNLLPTSSAVVKEDGIHSGGIRYSSHTAEAQEWFTRARMNRSFKVDFRVDAAYPRAGWVRRDSSAPWESCTALDEDMVLAQSTSEDVLFKLEHLTLARRDEDQKQRQSNLGSNARIEQVVKNALSLTEVAQEGMTKADKLKNLNEKRNLEKVVQRRILNAETNPVPPHASEETPTVQSKITPNTTTDDLVRLASAAWKDKQ